MDRKRRGVREARLSYRILARADGEDGVLSLAEIRLHTGRTHQIRVQFASRKMPLYGDSRYGGVKGAYLGLWSHRLTFPHPITDNPLTSTSNPDWSVAPWCYFKRI